MERRGRKSAAQTPAPQKDRIKGSTKNPKGSAASKKSGEKIELSDSITTTLENKRDEYNKKHPNGKVTLGTLKAVFRRGAGAFSSSYRPTITGGRPNSRSAWAFARVNKFLLKKGGTKVKAAYVQDDDLMEKGGLLYHLGGDMSKHLAPNGKPSNLTHEQWHLVRTPEFKAWFGDWENDPENASKVVDYNGEPLVVYHGTYAKEQLKSFDFEKADLGFHFGTFEQAKDRSETKIGFEGYKSIVTPYFLNIRKQFNILDVGEFDYPQRYLTELIANNVITEKEANENNFYRAIYRKDNKKIRDFLKAKYGENVGFEYENKIEGEGKSFIVLHSNQIKLADGTNTTFDGSNPDIRFDKGGLINALEIGIENLKKNGIVLKDKNETITVIVYNTGNQERKPSLYNKSLIYKSVQPIKSANEIIQNFDLQDFENFNEDKIKDYEKSNLIILNQNEVVYDSSVTAPNKKKSNLSTKQYRLVRTPEFKAWFGDWENDPENASEVVDSNGEPKIVYHGYKNIFNEFKKNKIIWLTPDAEYLEKMKGLVGENKFELFANAKKMIDLSGYGYKYYDQETAYRIFKNHGIDLPIILNQPTGAIFYTFIQLYQDEIKSQLKNLGYDGIKVKAHRNFDFVFAIFDSNQVKLADGSNTTFDAFNSDIRFKDGGKTGKEITCVNCGWNWNTSDSDEYDKYVCHKCGFDNRTFYDADPIGLENDIKMDKKIALPDSYANYGTLKPLLEKQGYSLNKIKGEHEYSTYQILDNELVYNNNQANNYFENNILLNKAPSILNISDRHNIDLEIISNYLKHGIKIEIEKTKNKNAAKNIALHNLYKSPLYYEKLKIMEKELDLDEHYESIKNIYNIGGIIDPVLSFSTPTGQPSKLTYLQQVLVRTSSFKSFFGDWEYAAKQFLANGRVEYDSLYKNVSKVIDKITLEPKVVYHGTRVDAEFFIFDVSQQSGIGRPYGYFAHNKEYSENFLNSNVNNNSSSQPFLYNCFVNVRNPFYAITTEYYDVQENAEYWKKEISKTIALDKYTNSLDKNKLKKINDVVESQIGKYIENTIVNKQSFWLLMARDEKQVFKYFMNNYRYDGIFYAEEFTSSYASSNPAEFSEAVTIFEPSQVKLADGRNLNFETMNNDVRYKLGGNLEKAQNKQEKYEIMGKRENLRNVLIPERFAEGGEVVGNNLQDGNDGKKGGYFEGRSHAEGGIKAINKDTGQLLEVEGQEVIITKNAVNDNKKREFEGQMLTNREILSRINQSGGGVSFAKGGEMESISCGCSGKKYKYGGEMIDDYSIAKMMNQPFEIISNNFDNARTFVDMLVNKLK